MTRSVCTSQHDRRPSHPRIKDPQPGTRSFRHTRHTRGSAARRRKAPRREAGLPLSRASARQWQMDRELSVPSSRCWGEMTVQKGTQWRYEAQLRKTTTAVLVREIRFCSDARKREQHESLFPIIGRRSSAFLSSVSVVTSRCWKKYLLVYLSNYLSGIHSLMDDDYDIAFSEGVVCIIEHQGYSYST